jgi:hypothetical protein
LPDTTVPRRTIGQCRKGSEIRRHMNSPADDTEIAIAIDPRLLVLVPAPGDV